MLLVFFRASPLVFLHRFLRLPADWVERWLVRVWLYMAVYTCTLCSCKQQRRESGGVGGSSGRGDHNGVGVTFICTQNGVCVGPGPPSLILYKLTPSPHPQTHTNTAEETDSRPPPHPPPTLFSLLFTPLLSSSTPFALKIYCIPRAEHFLNYRLEVS